MLVIVTVFFDCNYILPNYYYFQIKANNSNGAQVSRRYERCIQDAEADDEDELITDAETNIC